MSINTPSTIAIARGDGIGPEIMDATLNVLEAANTGLTFEEVKIGKAVYESGHSSGITPESWERVRQNQILLKAPITTPQGGGYKSLNVTLRKSLGLFANVRPCQAYTPFVESRFPNMDVVIVRENEEDLYGGIEHMQTNEVAQCLKLVSRPGSESIVRYAFEYARAHGRKHVTCMTKDNIMKMTDGLFHQIFEEVSAEYPDIEADHKIIDIGAAELATNPESFDVIVTLNLYGDIISDIAAQQTGSVGLAGSANIGRACSMFEAIHGSAPDIAGQDMANPSGLLNAGVMLLAHLNQPDAAERIRNAWLTTLEDGIHTPDIYDPAQSKEKTGTAGFAEAVKARLGARPKQIEPDYFDKSGRGIKLFSPQAPTQDSRQLTGVDVFLYWDQDNRNPDVLGHHLAANSTARLPLKMITNRGTKVYPGGIPETFSTDHWRCRFVGPDTGIEEADVIDLLNSVTAAGLEIVKTEYLYQADGARSYSLGQGE